MTSKLLALFVVVFLFCIGCATFHQDARIYQGHSEGLRLIQSINIDDGVSAEEASILADSYFMFFVSGCGALDRPIDKNDYWEFNAYIGDSGTKMNETIRVDKLTGAVSMKGYPSCNITSDRVCLK